MIFRVDRMIADVRVAIDLNAGDRQLLGEHDIDTLEMDRLIGSKLLDACRLVLLEAPRELLCTGHTFKDAKIDWNANAEFKDVALPQDFLRLIAFQMGEWHRPVREPIGEDSPQYDIQFSRFSGIRGNNSRPVAAIVMTEGGKVLRFRPTSPDDIIMTADYQPKPMIDRDGGIDLPEELYKACVLRSGALALATYGDQLSSTMMEMSKSMIES